MSKKTVFIIGAGASKEIGLPTGNELRETISRLLNLQFDFSGIINNGDSGLYQAIRNHVESTGRERAEINEYIGAARDISSAIIQATSIDDFIDSHRSDDRIAFCGKLAIAKSILDAERRSDLFNKNINFDGLLNYEALDKTWYGELLKLLIANCEIEEFKTRIKDITFIVFNYDRCLEQYLYYAVKNFYKISDTQALEIINLFNIFHPYGLVGELWPEPNYEKIPYGTEPSTAQLLKISKQIKTFSEALDFSTSEIEIIRNTIRDAHKIIFLGFAFHPINMQLLTPTELSNRPHLARTYATTFGLSDSDTEVIEQEIATLGGHAIDARTKSMKCYELFHEYSRAIALGT
ncbi:MAG: hypothetical protein COA85_00595 [Robiginitomaculum sp.]|nr:MAG: hypothetical protein COA85_00595 [Robiginitomaculum sp.]